MPQYKLKFSDDATSTLAAGITAASPSLQLVSGGGSLFPSLVAGQAFIGTLVKNGSPAIKEIVLVTGRSGDNLTGLTRDYGGTGALTWNAGDTFAMLQPAEAMNAFAQFIDLQKQVLNFATETGAGSAYVGLLTPLPNAHIVGMPIRFQATHASTGDSTFNDGIGAAPIRKAARPSGQSALLPNDIVAGGIYEVIWDGTVFQLSDTRDYFDLISGQVSNGQVPLSAVLQWEASLVIGFNQITGQLQNGQVAPNLALPGSPTANTQAVGDVSVKIATTAFVNPGSSIGANGYRKQPDGGIDQWGICNPGGGSAAVTFPVAFPTACDSLTFGQISGGPTQVYVTAAATRFGFTVSNTGGQTYWRAKGR
jgi:hypothetical protein